MIEMFSFFFEIIELEYQQIKSAFGLGCILMMIFSILLRKGFTKYDKMSISAFFGGVMLSMAVALICSMTVLGRTRDIKYSFELIPLQSYIISLRENNMYRLAENLLNISMFIPLGLFMPCCFGIFERYRNVIGVSLFYSISVELVQGFGKIGIFEIDDILNNVTGAGIGVLIYHVWKKEVSSKLRKGIH